MFRNLCCAPVRRQLDKKYLSTIGKARGVLNCGLNIVKSNINAIFHGPTGEEILNDVDLSNKTCLITGANSGIGLEMTRCLSNRNCNVLMACRNTYEAGLRARNVCNNHHRVRVYKANLASLRSVKECTDEILQSEKQIDIVILNAAVFGLPWTLTVDMLETSFQVNYLSQYFMLMNLEKILAPDARIVFMSAESHRNINMSFQNKMMPSESVLSLPEDQYTSIRAYNISKLCGILAMQYMSFRWVKTDKSVFCAHPGSFVKTRLCRNWWPYEVLYTFMLPFSKNVQQAASTPLFCATSPQLAGLSNIYYKDCKQMEPSELALDSHFAFRIHDLTQDMIRSRMRLLETEETVEVEEPVETRAPALEDNLTPNILQN